MNLEFEMHFKRLKRLDVNTFSQTDKTDSWVAYEPLLLHTRFDIIYIMREFKMKEWAKKFLIH